MPKTPRSRLAQWWPLPFGVFIAVYAALVPEPFAADSEVLESIVFGAAAALLIASALWPSRRLRLVALWLVTIAALGRAAVLVLNPPAVDPQRTAAGVAVWLCVAYLVTILTVFAELNATPRGPKWTSPS